MHRAACARSQKKQIPVEPSIVQGVMAAEGDAATELVQLLYDFIHGPTFQ